MGTPSKFQSRIFDSSGVQEFVRYFAASLMALILDVGVLAFLTEIIAIPYLLSGAISFSLGILVIYMFSVLWVFRNERTSNRSMEIAVFFSTGIIGLCINEFILWLLSEKFGIFYLFSKSASVAIVFFWNFFSRKALLFNTSK